MKFFILLTASYMSFTTSGFAQWSGTTPVTFGAPPSANTKTLQKGGCTGTGLCPSSFGISGVSTNFLFLPNNPPPPPGSPISIGMSFDLATAQQNGFITPSPGQPYIISNSFTFPQNNAAGIPGGTVIAAGTQCTYTPNNGAPGISCIACAAIIGVGSNNAHVKKPSAAEKKKAAQDVTKKAKDLVEKKKKK